MSTTEKKIKFHHRVINAVENAVFLLEQNQDSSFEYSIDREQFENENNIKLGTYHSIIYEPDHKLFMVQKSGQDPEAFDSPDDHPILAAIHKRADEIIEKYHNEFLDNRTPKFHTRVGTKIYLEDDKAADYLDYQIKKEAMHFLNKTDYIMMRALETAILDSKPVVDAFNSVDPDIMSLRDEAKKFIGDDLIRKFELKSVGLIGSPGSEAKVKAGLKPPFKDRFNFLPKVYSKIKDELEKARIEREAKKQDLIKKYIAEGKTGIDAAKQADVDLGVLGSDLKIELMRRCDGVGPA